MKTKILLLTLLSCGALTATSQQVLTGDSADIYWQRCIGGTNDEALEAFRENQFQSTTSTTSHIPLNRSDMVLTPDGGFILVTTTFSKDGDLKGLRKYPDSANKSDVWVVKLDKEGRTEWTNCFGGSEYDYGSSVAVVDDGYIIGGTTTSKDGTFSENKTLGSIPFLVKLNKAGEIVRTTIVNNTPGISASNIVQKLLPRPGNGCYMLYTHINTTEGIPSLLANEYDSTGAGTGFSILMAGGSGVLIGTNMYKLENGGVRITGYTNSSGGYFADNIGKFWRGFVIETNSSFRITSVTSYTEHTNADNTQLFAAASGPENSLYIGGKLIEMGTQYGWISKRNKDGSFWNKRFPSSLYQIQELSATDDGGVLAVGRGYFNGINAVDNQEIVLIKLDANGNLQWTRSFQGNKHDYAFSMAVENEKSIYLMGVTKSETGMSHNHNQNGTFDLWVARTGRINAVKGNVFYDVNKNGIRETDEFLLTNSRVNTAKVGGDSVISAATAGTYYHVVDTGSYKTTVLVPNRHLFNILPGQDSTYFQNRGQIKQVNFAVQPIKDYPDARIELLPDSWVRPGMDQHYTLRYTNDGTLPLPNPVVTVVKDNRQTLISTVPPPTLVKGDTLQWNLATLNVLHNGVIYINTKGGIPPNLNLGDTVSWRATIRHALVDSTPVNNEMELRQAVRASFDPNDKQEIHDGTFYKKQYDRDDYLYYRIRFQNTGTDTAFNVELRDTLTNRLLPHTAELIATSHPCRFVIAGNVLTWKFSNILLPPKIQNEPASNGYAYFRIKAVPGLQLNDSITNKAAIYFDYNFPVITNTHKTMIMPDKQVITAVENVLNPTGAISMYPNPTREAISLLYKGTKLIKATVTLYDLAGKKLISYTNQSFLPNKYMKLSLPMVSKGVYIVNVQGKSLNESLLLQVD